VPDQVAHQRVQYIWVDEHPRSLEVRWQPFPQ
jgi:hypothetical protein